jgi:hypothetical protein
VDVDVLEGPARADLVVRQRVLRGPVSSRPLMIIRATQKKMMSKDVTRTFVG